MPRSGRSSGDGNGNPLQLFLPEESHGQGSLVGYSPWGCEESDLTEQLTLTQRISHSVKKPTVARRRLWVPHDSQSVGRSVMSNSW